MKYLDVSFYGTGLKIEEKSMGADIHMWAETRLRPTDPWQAYRSDDLEATPRNYYMFSLVAGVRGQCNPLFSVRGFPKDLSEGLAHVPGELEHTPTWLTLQEFKRCLVALNRMCLREGDKHDELYYKLVEPGSGLDPYIWKYKVEDRNPTYSDTVAHFEGWILREKAEAELLGITDVNPEVRFIIFFDS